MALFDPIFEESLRVFGEKVEVMAADGSITEILAIFDEIYREVDPGSVQVVTLRPTLQVRLSDYAPLAASKTLINARGARFKVMNTQKDGIGGALLELHRI